MAIDRREFLRMTAASAAGLTITAGTVRLAFAAPLNVGVLIPGSKSDKGWMESGYDGLKAAEKRHGDKIKVTYIENVKFADMEQALVTLATKNVLVIGVGGQTEASVRKVAKRFPKVKFSVVGGNRGTQDDNVAQYDVRQAEIAFVAGAAAAMLSKNGAVSYVGGLEIPAIVNAGKEFGNGAKLRQARDQVHRERTPATSTTSPSRRRRRWPPSAQGADIHYHILNLGLRGMEQAAREKNTHIIGSYTDRCGTNPLYVAYTITGVGYQVEYAIDQLVAGTWKAEFKPFGLAMGPKASDIDGLHGQDAGR